MLPHLRGNARLTFRQQLLCAAAAAAAAGGCHVVIWPVMVAFSFNTAEPVDSNLLDTDWLLFIYLFILYYIARAQSELHERSRMRPRFFFLMMQRSLQIIFISSEVLLGPPSVAPSAPLLNDTWPFVKPIARSFSAPGGAPQPPFELYLTQRKIGFGGL